MYTCDVCKVEQKRIAFPSSQINKIGDSHQNSYLRCTACMTCAQCCIKFCAQAFNGEDTLCQKCRAQEQEHECFICKAIQGAASFPRNAVENNAKHNSVMICMSCCGRGFSTRDTEPYSCIHGCVVGHRSFKKYALRNHKTPGRHDSLTCNACGLREGEIRKKLNARGSWKCTCGSQMTHQERCLLFPARSGEQRWPGKNKDVSADDWEFIRHAAKRQRQ